MRFHCAVVFGIDVKQIAGGEVYSLPFDVERAVVRGT